MQESRFMLGDIPALLLGEPSERIYLFVHGKNGSKQEAAAFADIACPAGWQVLGIDLPQHGERQGDAPAFDPWHAVPELRAVMGYARAHWKHIALRANSIGAWFSMLALAEAPPESCLFVSPILDMQRLIENMMLWAGVDAQRLEKEGEIATTFGETLSWRYYCFAREHSITRWSAPTAILYAGRDNLTERATAEDFAGRFGCRLTVLPQAEHWFHTPEQLAALEAWERKNI